MIPDLLPSFFEISFIDRMIMGEVSHEEKNE